jgi:hypothetical protein
VGEQLGSRILTNVLVDEDLDFGHTRLQ